MQSKLKTLTFFTVLTLLIGCGPGVNPITETRKPKNQNTMDDFADKSSNDAESATSGAADSKNNDASAEDGAGGGDSEMASDDGLEPGLKESESSEILITEYLEGTNGEAALELTNISLSSIDLADYQLNKVEATLNESSYEFSKKELKAGRSMVLCTSKNGLDQAFTSKCDLKLSFIDHDGNEAYKLFKNQAILVDSFGDSNIPAEEWSSQSNDGKNYSTKNTVLRRNCSVKIGSTDFNQAFLPHLEWEQFKSDDYSNLGKWDCN